MGGVRYDLGVLSRHVVNSRVHSVADRADEEGEHDERGDEHEQTKVH